LPVSITESEVIVYNPDIREIARHERLPASATGKCSTHHEHRLGPDLRRKQELPRQRFEELGAGAVSFLDQPIRTRRFGKDEAVRILGLLSTYHSTISLPLSSAPTVVARSLSLLWSASWRLLPSPIRFGIH
jgi:hypothetical protein